MKKTYVLIAFLVSISTALAIPASAAENTVRIQRATDTGISLEATFAAFELSTIQAPPMQTITAEGYGFYGTSGYPGVPVKSILIDLPAACDLDLAVTQQDLTVYNDIVLAPVPERIMLTSSEGDPYLSEERHADAAAYARNSFYPGRFAEIEYTGFLRDRRVAKLNLLPAQYNPQTRELLIYKKLHITLHYKNVPGRAGTERHNRFSEKSPAGKGAFTEIYSKCLLNYPAPGGNSVLPEHLPQRVSAPAAAWTDTLQASPFAVKAEVAADGIYKMTYEEINALGIDITAATNENLAMANQGQDIAIYCSGTGKFKPGDYILFYGRAFKSLYSKTNVYWLYQGSGAGKRMQTVDGQPGAGAKLQNTYSKTVHAEQDLKYWQGMPPFTEGLDHWFWDKLSIIEPPLKRDFTIGLGYLDRSSGSCSLTLNLYGQTNTGQNPDHHTRVYVNNNAVDDFTWDGQTDLTRTIPDIAPEKFVDGDNVITLEAVADTGATVDSYYVNWFDVSCWGNYTAENDMLRFHNKDTGDLKFSIAGFTADAIWAFDVTDPAAVRRITSDAVYKSGSNYTFEFQDTLTENRTYWALTGTALRSVATLTADAQSSLAVPRDAVDYIIITHEKFYDRVQELKSYRESKGLKVAVVTAQDVYDEFSYGIKDAQAIKDFLAYAYLNWNGSGHPSYVLLVGDTTVDYRDDLGLYAEGEEDFVPTYLYPTQQLGDTPTDNWFVCVNGTDYLPDMIIGRLCVKTDDDVKNIIDKIKTYEAEKSAAWCGNVIFAADNEAIFESVSDSLVAMLPDGFNAIKVYISQYQNIAAATEDLVSRINAGAVITNYTGHGSTDNWSGEFLFHTEDNKDNIPRNDIDLLENGDALTFILSLNCLNGFFASPFDSYSLAEEFMRAEGRGAVACLSPTGLGYPSEHQVLAKKIFTGFFTDEDSIAGSLVTTAKIQAYNQINARDIIETFTLFGDPATELKLISGGDFTAFKTLEPADQETLPVLPLPTFTWGAGLYERFKVQFSPDPAFGIETTITAPLFSLRFITTERYTPNIFIWAFVNILAGQNNRAMHWRVVAYDEDFNQIAATEPQSFILQR